MAERAARLRVQQTQLDRQRGQHLGMMSDDWWDAEVKKRNPAVEKVNWLKEGF
jgi:hypothetical protein